MADFPPVRGRPAPAQRVRNGVRKRLVLGIPDTAPATPRCRPSRGDVAFEHVTFRYRIDGPEVLSAVNLEVPAGQVICVVGPSGSGKSTLSKPVQRLYVPESGRVLVDGVDLA